MTIRPALAELLGAFTLTLIVALSSTSFITQLDIPTPYLAGLTLGLFVYTVGAISGAHLNPAVTIALATIKKISMQDAVSYMLAQFVGAIAASFVAWKVTGTWINFNDSPNTVLVTLAEAMGAFILVWGILSVVEGKVSKGASGLVIGGSLTLGVLIAVGIGSNGVLNPAVALGIHSFSSAYLVGPIVGAIAAAWGYTALSKARS